ncbi:MAG TPA: glycosyltransferase [Prolixibacteraceae bacterium]|nr:glycosyltransferase [Prolixibacteraceae bacterium]
MKIAFLIGVNDVGGAEFVSYHHVMMAYRNGFDVIVLSGTTGRFYELIKTSGVKIEVVTMNPTLDKVSRLIHGCDVVFNCNFFAITPLVIQLKQKIGFRYLTILHSDINWVYNQVVKFEKGTDGYYAIHQKIMDSFISYGVMDKRKFVVIPNCVDFDLISAESHYHTTVRSKFGFKDGDFVIGMITRVAADKNILDAVKILAKLPASINARLLIIGGVCASAASADYLMRVNRLIQTIGAGKFRNRVTITGNLATEDVYKTMQAFDIGLNCSPSEGLPIALLEMMGAGIPCVMPGIGDIPDVLTGRGIVVPIRQRLEIKEILAEPCYSPAEMELFVQAITYLHRQRASLGLMGNDAAQYVSEFRSLKFQEKHFLNFLDMGKKTEVGSRKTEEKVKAKSDASIAAIDLIDNTIEGSTVETQLIASVLKEPQLIAPIPEFPKVSVLMPIRDGNEMWIGKAIESIANQDYEGEMELLVINHDCRLSQAAFIERLVMEQSSQKIPIACLVIKDVTLQFSEVLDFGVGYSNGDIIVRMDCDDIAEPNLVSKMVEFLEANKDFDVCGVQVQFFGAKEMVTTHPPVVTRQSAFEMPGTWFINHPGVAIRKSALLNVGGYGKTKTGFAEDYHLWCEILKSGGMIANLPDVLLNYRCYQKEWRYPEGYAEFLQKEKAGLKGH